MSHLWRWELLKTGDCQVGNWHVNCQHSSVTLFCFILPQLAQLCTAQYGYIIMCVCLSWFDNTQQQPSYGPLSRTTWVSWYQKKHSPTSHPDHHPIFISFFHLSWSIASSLFKLRAWQSFCPTSFHVLFGLPLVWSPPPHIPYITSPNQCLLFATHAHTIGICFAVVS